LVKKKDANLSGLNGIKTKGVIQAVIDEDEDAFGEGEDSEEEERRLLKERKQNQANLS